MATAAAGLILAGIVHFTHAFWAKSSWSSDKQMPHYVWDWTKLLVG